MIKPSEGNGKVLPPPLSLLGFEFQKRRPGRNRRIRVAYKRNTTVPCAGRDIPAWGHCLFAVRFISHPSAPLVPVLGLIPTESIPSPRFSCSSGFWVDLPKASPRHSVWGWEEGVRIFLPHFSASGGVSDSSCITMAPAPSRQLPPLWLLSVGNTWALGTPPPSCCSCNSPGCLNVPWCVFSFSNTSVTHSPHSVLSSWPKFCFPGWMVTDTLELSGGFMRKERDGWDLCWRKQTGGPIWMDLTGVSLRYCLASISAPDQVSTVAARRGWETSIFRSLTALTSGTWQRLPLASSYSNLAGPPNFTLYRKPPIKALGHLWALKTTDEVLASKTPHSPGPIDSKGRTIASLFAFFSRTGKVIAGHYLETL